MILFHGSDVAVKKVILQQCRPYKDFGRGFYLTPIKSHADKMAARTALRNGSSPIVSRFSFDQDQAVKCGLKIKIFETESNEWAEFVYRNREDRDFSHEYDIVMGPIADDGLRFRFNQYKKGIISVTDLIKGLKFKERTFQYCFLSEASLKLLVPYE